MKTNSDANLEKCPDTKIFAESVLKEFDIDDSMVKPMHWVVSKDLIKMVEVTTICASSSTRITNSEV